MASVRWFVPIVGAALLAPLAGNSAPRRGRPAPTPPAIAVVECPTAERWLGRAGIEFQHRAAARLGGEPISGVRVLVLPIESVLTRAAAEMTRQYVAAGGSVVGVYWGTLTGGPESPCAQVGEVLGVRPVRWYPDAPGPLLITSPGTGLLPYGTGAQIPLPGHAAVAVRPVPPSKVVGTWPNERTAGVAAPAIVQRGRTIYLSLNLFAAAGDRERELFFWAIQRVSPAWGGQWQARDRIASAAEACAALVSAGLDQGTSSAGVDAARTALMQARTLLGSNQSLQAAVAADRSRRIAEDLLDADGRTGR